MVRATIRVLGQRELAERISDFVENFFDFAVFLIVSQGTRRVSYWIVSEFRGAFLQVQDHLADEDEKREEVRRVIDQLDFGGYLSD